MHTAPLLYALDRLLEPRRLVPHHPSAPRAGRGGLKLLLREIPAALLGSVPAWETVTGPWGRLEGYSMAFILVPLPLHAAGS
jgi:hypothetical protein